MRPLASSAVRRRLAATLFMASLAAVAAPQAQADTLFGVSGGWFVVNDDSRRPTDDVIYQNGGFLVFDTRDFNGGTAGAEFLVGSGRHLEFGIGAGYYNRTVFSVYRDYVNVSGAEIEQDTRLQMVPVSATVRFFPAGRFGGVQPYIGGGVAVINWKYTEVGEFVDFNNDYEVFAGDFTDKGNVVAPVILGGIRFAVSDAMLLGGEFRYQGGTADLDPSLGFAGNRLDLGGLTSQVTLHVRF